MLQVLQYLVGTSIAAVVDWADLIMTQSFTAGPSRSGSSSSSAGGICWIFLGRICVYQSVTARCGKLANNEI